MDCPLSQQDTLQFIEVTLKQKANNEFDPFLNECQTYVWEWYIPEHIVRFGIPSLNSLWVSNHDNNIKLATMLERVHPDDVEKIFVRQNSPIYRSDKMFEVDLRLNVAAELKPDGTSSGQYEWYGFRGKIVRRDEQGKPAYLRGVAINIDHRVKVQMKLLSTKDRQIQTQRQHVEYCLGVMQEFKAFISNLASHADGIITGEMQGTREERLREIYMLKQQGEHLMELIDRASHVAGGQVRDTDNEVTRISLWEHLAELQQVYSLRMPQGMKVYFSNLYDDVTIYANDKLLDLMLENVVNSQMHNTRNGYLTLTYRLLNPDFIQFCVTCTESEAQFGNLEMVLTEGGMSLSFCRLLAKRLFGEVEVKQTEDRRLHYMVTLPVDARQIISPAGNSTPGVTPIREAVNGMDDDLLSDNDADAGLSELAVDQPADIQVSVLVGSNDSPELFQNQHLFNVIHFRSTDALWEAYKSQNPDIVFVDYNLSGHMQIDEAIQKMHDLYPATPIIVTAQYATRTLHHRIQLDGARYLLRNPLSLRKINVMIKKYLK